MIRRIQKQIEAECSCTNCCKKTPDLTIFSIGANDLKFSKIVSGIMTNTAADQFSAMPERLKLLEENFQRLAAELKDLKIVPNSVFFVEYFDLIKNSEGFVDASCGLLLANSFNFELAEKQIMQPLTELIRQTCTQNSWNYLSGIRDLFSTRGVCSNISYVNGIAESLTLQGDVTGAFHPNCAGHEEIAKFISPNLESYLGSKIRFTAKWITFFCASFQFSSATMIGIEIYDKIAIQVEKSFKNWLIPIQRGILRLSILKASASMVYLWMVVSVTELGQHLLVFSCPNIEFGADLFYHHFFYNSLSILDNHCN